MSNFDEAIAKVRGVKRRLKKANLLQKPYIKGRILKAYKDIQIEKLGRRGDDVSMKSVKPYTKRYRKYKEQLNIPTNVINLRLTGRLRRNLRLGGNGKNYYITSRTPYAHNLSRLYNGGGRYSKWNEISKSTWSYIFKNTISPYIERHKKEIDEAFTKKLKK